MLLVAALVAGVVALGVLPLGTGTAGAAPDGYTAQQDGAGDRLVRIDLGTGSSTPAAEVIAGVTGIQDLARGDDGALYGVSPTKDLLVRIDPDDGKLRSSVAISVDVSAAGITFTADGTLWMTATVASGVRLYTVDPATGHATEVGLLGTPGAPDISGLVTTCDDEILGIAGSTQVVRVDRDPPQVQPFFPAFSAGPQGLGLDPATRTVWGLQSSDGADPGRLWHVDPETGALTDTGTTTRSGTLRGLVVDELPCGDEVEAAAAPEPLLLAPNFTG